MLRISFTSVIDAIIELHHHRTADNLLQKVTWSLFATHYFDLLEPKHEVECSVTNVTDYFVISKMADAGNSTQYFSLGYLAWKIIMVASPKWNQGWENIFNIILVSALMLSHVFFFCGLNRLVSFPIPLHFQAWQESNKSNKVGQSAAA